jgi:hypothetical protein
MTRAFPTPASGTADAIARRPAPMHATGCAARVHAHATDASGAITRQHTADSGEEPLKPGAMGPSIFS